MDKDKDKDLTHKVQDKDKDFTYSYLLQVAAKLTSNNNDTKWSFTIMSVKPITLNK